MSLSDNDVDKLISNLLEKPKMVKDKNNSKLHKVVIPEKLLNEGEHKEEVSKDPFNDNSITNSGTISGTLITGNNNTINNYFESSKKNYKRDTSASSLNREITDYRNIGDQIDVHQMTRNEYISHLGYLYQLTNVHKWDGIERLHHRPNWTPDFSHNVKDYDEALEFIGIEKNESAPDGLEKRHFDRRQGLKDIRLDNINRRIITEKGRRKEDRINYAVYFATVIFLLIIIVAWISISVVREYGLG